MKALRFEGNGLEYFKIWIVNILLTIITLGLYRPWAKVRNQRYLYANSTLQGRNFEYHATGKQLFISYLITIALFIVYIIVLQASPVGGMIATLALFLATPWIILRSLKFNLRMTSFSNVRFSFDGSLGNAYIIFMLLPIALLLAVLSAPFAVGFTIPLLLGSISVTQVILIALVVITCLVLAFYLFAVLKKRSAAYTINGCQYGQGRFSANIKTKAFAIILLKTIGLSILAMTVFMVAMAIIVSTTIGLSELVSMQQQINDPAAMQNIMSGGLLIIIVPVYIAMIFISFLIIAYSYARQRAYIFANTALDKNITFASTLTARSMAWVMTTNLFIIAFSLGLGFPWAKVRMVRLILENTQVNTDAGFEQYITQQQQEQSSLGEQIGDAFDVNVEVGI